MNVVIVLLNILTTVTLLAGLFFLLAGAMGVWRLPDLYHRMIAASKCITLGITGMLLACVCHLAVLGFEPPVEGIDPSRRPSVVAVATKAFLVILFQFVAAPIAAHVLARAAHRAAVEKYHGTLSDELEEDVKSSGVSPPRSPTPAKRRHRRGKKAGVGFEPTNT